MSFCKLNHTLFVTINNFCGSLLTEHLTTAFGRNCSTQLRRNSPKILGRFKIRAFPVCFIWSKNSLKSWHCGNTHLISGDVEEFVDFPLVLCSWYCCQSTYILKSHFDSSKYSHKISVLPQHSWTFQSSRLGFMSRSQFCWKHIAYVKKSFWVWKQISSEDYARSFLVAKIHLNRCSGSER